MGDIISWAPLWSLLYTVTIVLLVICGEFVPIIVIY